MRWEGVTEEYCGLVKYDNYLDFTDMQGRTLGYLQCLVWLAVSALSC